MLEKLFGEAPGLVYEARLWVSVWLKNAGVGVTLSCNLGQAFHVNPRFQCYLRRGPRPADRTKQAG